MPENLEIKAYLADIDTLPEACQRIGAELTRSFVQQDTYFHVPRGRLKIRESSGCPPSLIAYERINSPGLRESHFKMLSLQSQSDGERLKAMLIETIAERGVVVKHRDVYKKDAALINVDAVEGLGNFLEIEVDVSGGREAAMAAANEISGHLGVSLADTVPWSYIDMLKMYEVASAWQAKFLSARTRGSLILLDGASGTGKTTLAHMLVEDEKLDLTFIPRFSTREPRRMQGTESEYVFVKRDEFENLAQNGELLEFRDFDFGMSYGLAWQHVAPPLLEGRNALAIINLGNVRHVKQILPQALTILIHASADTIRERLVRRGMNDQAQIAERLASARIADSYRPYYDHVINNEEGMLNDAANELKEVISASLSRARAT